MHGVMPVLPNGKTGNTRGAPQFTNTLSQKKRHQTLAHDFKYEPILNFFH